MSKSKRRKDKFDGQDKRPSNAVLPVHAQQVPYPTRERLEAMIEVLRRERKKLDKATVDLLMRLTILPPAVRLKINMGNIMKKMVEGRVHSILQDGLTPEERLALVDLQLKRVPTEVLETAHGLLNIDERHKLVGAFRTVFDREIHRKEGFLYAEEAQTLLEGKPIL